MTKFSYAVIIFFIILLNVSYSYADIPEIVLYQKRAVVTIYVNDKDGKQIGTGTGFIIDSNGIIATNYHVMSMCLEGNNTTLIKMENGAFFPLSELVNFDEENDVAIFKIDGKELPMVKIARNYEPKQGENIVVVGSPLGLETTVSDGIISSIRGKGGIIQITAPISPGSSGSPVFNSKGEVIGVATFNIIGGQNLNFAIPVKHVENLLKGTKKPSKKGIVKSEPLPAVMPEPATRSQELTAECWCYKALTLWFEGKFTDSKKAIEYLNNAIKLQPENYYYVLRGVAYTDLGQYQRAIADYTEAIRLKPDDADEVHNNRGFAYDKLGQYRRAIADYNKAIRLRPDFARAYSNRGSVYQELGQLQRAIKDYNQAIHLKPDYADTYYNRGNAYRNLGQLQRAIEDYNQVIRLQPDDSDAYNNRGVAYFLQGNNKLGCIDAQKTCELGDCESLEWAKGKGRCH